MKENIMKDNDGTQIILTGNYPVGTFDPDLEG